MYIIICNINYALITSIITHYINYDALYYHYFYKMILMSEESTSFLQCTLKKNHYSFACLIIITESESLREADIGNNSGYTQITHALQLFIV